MLLTERYLFERDDSNSMKVFVETDKGNRRRNIYWDTYDVEDEQRLGYVGLKIYTKNETDDINVSTLSDIGVGGVHGDKTTNYEANLDQIKFYGLEYNKHDPNGDKIENPNDWKFRMSGERLTKKGFSKEPNYSDEKSHYVAVVNYGSKKQILWSNNEMTENVLKRLRYTIGTVDDSSGTTDEVIISVSVYRTEDDVENFTQISQIEYNIKREFHTEEDVNSINLGEKIDEKFYQDFIDSETKKSLRDLDDTGREKKLVKQVEPEPQIISGKEDMNNMKQFEVLFNNHFLGPNKNKIEKKLESIEDRTSYIKNYMMNAYGIDERFFDIDGIKKIIEDYLSLIGKAVEPVKQEPKSKKQSIVDIINQKKGIKEPKKVVQKQSETGIQGKLIYLLKSIGPIGSTIHHKKFTLENGSEFMDTYYGEMSDKVLDIEKSKYKEISDLITFKESKKLTVYIIKLFVAIYKDDLKEVFRGYVEKEISFKNIIEYYGVDVNLSAAVMKDELPYLVEISELITKQIFDIIGE